MSSSAVKDKVTSIIASNPIAIFSKSYCPYCTTAKRIISSHAQPFFAYELDMERDGQEVQRYLLEMTGQRTVPNIFIREKHVGGCDDLKRLESKGELAKMLE